LCEAPRERGPEAGEDIHLTCGARRALIGGSSGPGAGMRKGT
jgi:hypothetical protein